MNITLSIISSLYLITISNHIFGATNQDIIYLELNDANTNNPTIEGVDKKLALTSTVISNVIEEYDNTLGSENSPIPLTIINRADWNNYIQTYSAILTDKTVTDRERINNLQAAMHTRNNSALINMIKLYNYLDIKPLFTSAYHQELKQRLSSTRDIIAIQKELKKNPQLLSITKELDAELLQHFKQEYLCKNPYMHIFKNLGSKSFDHQLTQVVASPHDSTLIALHNNTITSEQFLNTDLKDKRSLLFKLKKAYYSPKPNIPVLGITDNDMLVALNSNNTNIAQITAQELVYSNDGSKMALLKGDSQQLWITNTAQFFKNPNNTYTITNALDNATITSFLFNKENTAIIAGHSDGSLLEFNCHNRTQSQYIKNPALKKSINHIFYNNTGTKIVTYHKDGFLGFWDTHTKQCLSYYDLQLENTSDKNKMRHDIIAQSSDKRYLATIDMKDKSSVHIFDLDTFEKVSTLLHPEAMAITGLSFNPQNATELVASSENGFITLWNLQNKTNLVFEIYKDTPIKVKHNHDGSQLILYTSHLLQIYTIADLQKYEKKETLREILSEKKSILRKAINKEIKRHLTNKALQTLPLALSTGLINITLKKLLHPIKRK